MIEAIAAHDKKESSMFQKSFDVALGWCLSFVACYFWCFLQQESESIMLSALNDQIPLVWQAYVLILGGMAFFSAQQRMQVFTGGMITAVGMFALLIRLRPSLSLKDLEVMCCFVGTILPLLCSNWILSFKKAVKA